MQTIFAVENAEAAVLACLNRGVAWLNDGCGVHGSMMGAAWLKMGAAWLNDGCGVAQ